MTTSSSISNWEFEPKTKGPIGLGLRRLVRRHPLYGVYIDRWDIAPSVSTETMGVSIGQDLRIHLAYNPEFVISLGADELVAVLEHEVNHVLFRHVLMTPEQYPDHQALVVATEVTANEFVTGPHPEGAMTLAEFPDLRPGRSTVERYLQLAGDQRPATSATQSEIAQIDPGSSSNSDPTKGSPGVCQGNATSDPAGETVDSRSEGSGSGWRRSVGRTLDDHDMWSAADGQIRPSIADAIVAHELAEAASMLPEDLRRQAAVSLYQAETQLPGHLKGDTLIELAGGKVPRTDWPRVLRSYLWRRTRPRPTMHRPSRRLPHLVGVVAGRTRMPHRPKVMAVLDTSGSMNEVGVLPTIRAEVKALSAVADIFMVECDKEVQREYKFDGDITEVAGGGGTSFHEPLKAAFLAKHRVDVVFYFTDGFGRAASQPPPVPVMWCLVGPWSRKPAAWGRVLRIAVSDVEPILV